MADQWTAKLDTYLDGELSGEKSRQMEVHLRACPDCVRDVLSRTQLRRAVQAAGRRFSPDPNFRQRVMRQVVARPARAWRWWPAAAAALAAVCVVGLFALNLARIRQQRGLAYSEIADVHVAALASPNPVDVLSTDRHTVKPWFEGKIPFAFDLPELQNSEFTLLGGRLVYLRQAPAAQLIYRSGKHQISVFIVQEAQMNAPLPAESGVQRRLSFTLDTWRQDGLRYFVIGDAEAPAIGRLADLFRKAAKG